MKNKFHSIAKIFLVTVVFAFNLSSCKEDINGDYYPPVIKIGFEDISDIVINNNDKNPNGGPDSTYVRVIKLVSDNTNNAVGVDCFFNLVEVSNTNEIDTTAFNTYIRLMNPILRRDSLNIDGTLFQRNLWDCSRANFGTARNSAAIQMRTIDFVQDVSKVPGNYASHEFMLKIIPDRSTPIKYIVDETKSLKKVKVVDGKQLTAPLP